MHRRRTLIPVSGQRANAVRDWFLVGSQMQIPPLPVFPLLCDTLGHGGAMQRAAFEDNMASNC